MQGERAREEEEELLQVTAAYKGGKSWKNASLSLSRISEGLFGSFPVSRGFQE